MKADRHQHRGEVQAHFKRQEAGHRHADAQQSKRQHGEGLLFQDQQHEHRGKRKETGHFPQTLQDADFNASEGCAFDDEVVEQSRPGIERHGHRYAHENQERDGPLP